MTETLSRGPKMVATSEANVDMSREGRVFLTAHGPFRLPP